jgi:uncharacterized protein YbjT (DUF2867 family)
MATQTLLGAAVRATAAHIVYVSIVGIEHIAKRGYPKAKLECEELVSGSGQPWTILRATQFYEYVLGGVRKLARLPVAPVPAGFRVKPVGAEDVAARLAALAAGKPASRVPDLAGPDETS